MIARLSGTLQRCSTDLVAAWVWVAIRRLGTRCIVLAGAACGDDGSLRGLRDAGRVRVGYAVEAPYAFVVGAGEVTGESPELARHVVAELGLGQVVWRQMEFALLFEELRAGTIDVIAAGTFITPERDTVVAFSRPTMRVGAGLLVQEGNPYRLDSYDRVIACAEVRAAALDGSVEADLLQQLGLPAARLRCVPDAVAGRAAVENGEVDCLALSQPTIQWMELDGRLGRTEVAAPFAAPRSACGYVAFAFRREDAALRTAWDGVLDRFVGSEAHCRLLQRFGLGAGQLPDRRMVAEVLRAW